MDANAIETRSLRKVYKSPPARRGAPVRPEVVALDALDLVVGEGEFFGLLGPNGAGKTTTIGILTTRVLPTGGRALIAGEDVVSHAVAVRRRIGVVPQRPNPDRGLDVIENLIFHAAYFGFPHADARRRAPGGTLIEISLDGPAAPVADTARAVAGVLSVEARDATLAVYHPRGGEAVAPLIVALQAAGRQVTNIRLAPPSLETLF